MLPPSALAFKSNRGDDWGEWKIRFGGTGLSADVQELYRFAGVTSGEPNPETSVAFFEWLNAEPSGRIAPHLEMVVRHLGNERSVRSWWEVREKLPCVPVEVGGDYRLVGLSVFAAREDASSCRTPRSLYSAFGRRGPTRG